METIFLLTEKQGWNIYCLNLTIYREQNIDIKHKTYLSHMKIIKVRRKKVLTFKKKIKFSYIPLKETVDLKTLGYISD